MSRKLSPASPGDQAAVERALQLLRDARILLASANAPRSAERVRLAITSTGGALRHVRRRRAAGDPQACA